MARCQDTGNVIRLIILSQHSGHQILTLTRSGFLVRKSTKIFYSALVNRMTICNKHFLNHQNRRCDIEGAGILQFSQVSSLLGYTLQDKWKKLLRIQTNWIPFCSNCLKSSRISARMSVTNLDGTSSGSFTFQKWTQLGFHERTFCIHFIPNLDRKAKYMLFAASLLPVINSIH